MKFNKIFETITPYKSEEVENFMRLHANENPYINREILNLLSEEIKNLRLNYYPEIDQKKSREILAKFFNVDYSNIAVGNGSDELIDLCIKIFSGNEIIILNPSFEMYSFYSKLNNLKINYINFDELNKINNLINENTRMIILCSPNNPCGRIIKKDIIKKILDSKIPVLLDEAYYEFCDENNFEFIKEYDNLIISRTFSKALGMAGARIGYIISSEKIISNLMKIKSPYSFSITNEKIVEIIIKNYDLIKINILKIIEERERMKKLLNVKFDSKSNFIVIESNEIDLLYNKLLDNKIIVKKLKNLNNCIRITVGNKSDNDFVIDIIKNKLNYY
jgi:histidinol-phosphate aminotransferase